MIPARPGRLRRLLPLALHALSFAVFAGFLASGLSYYSTPLAERPHHPDYWTLKPGGTLGLRFGVAGLAAMTLMHVYSLRKRLRPLRKLGPLAPWLDFHIVLGVAGPLLVLLHSSFKVGGLIAIAFWSMIAVAVSGVLGRYLYAQLPRGRDGAELTLAECEREAASLEQRLQRDFGLEPAQLERLRALALPAAPGAGLGGMLLGILADDLLLGRRRRLAAFLAGQELPRARVAELLATARTALRLRRRILLWEALHRLFHHWHVAHKPFAVVMYVFVLMHVAVATATGYGIF